MHQMVVIVRWREKAFGQITKSCGSCLVHCGVLQAPPALQGSRMFSPGEGSKPDPSAACMVREFQPRLLGSALDVREECEANICYSSILICSRKCFKSLECKVLSISCVPLQHEMELLDVLLAVKADGTLGSNNDNIGCGFSSPGTLEGTHLSTEGSL